MVKTRSASSVRLASGLLVCLLMLFTSCDRSDDTELIFTSHAWSFTGFCYTPNWNKADCSLLNITLNGCDDYQKHTILFHSDGSALITLPGCSLSARWKADGNSRSFTLSQFSVTDGNIDKISPFSAKFYKDLKATGWYRGDTECLELFDADTHYYLLFSPIK